MSGRQRWILSVALATIALWFSTTSFFFLRDNYATHYPVKVLTGEILRSGELPMWDPFSGGGQPLAGNPNYLTFYPSTFLHLLLPDHVAFTLHFVVHLILGFWGTFRLARFLGVGGELALAGAALYIVTGPVVSTTSFYNLVVVAGLTPWLAYFAGRLARSDRPFDDAFRLGGVAGLIGLSGEMVTTVAAGLLVLVLFGVELLPRWRQIVFATVVALVVVSPMVSAWEEIHANSERAVLGTSAAETLLASVSPERLSEIFLGPGVPRFDSGASEGGGVAAFLPSLLLGLLLVPAMLDTGRSSSGKRLRLALVLLIFLSLGSFNPVVSRAVELAGGVPFRYPQKLLLASSLAASLLAIIWLERWSEKSRATIGRVGIFVAIAIGVGGVIAVRGSWMFMASVLMQMAGLIVLLFPLERRTRVAAIFVVLGVGIRVLDTVPVGDAETWSQPPVLAELLRDSAITVSRIPELENATLEETYERYRESLVPSWGAQYGIRYPFARSGEGMYSYLSRIEGDRHRAVGDSTPAYGQIAGITHILGDGTTELVDETGERTVVPVSVKEVERLPAYRVPPIIVGVRTVEEAVRVIEGAGFDPATVVVTGGEDRSNGAAVVRVEEATTQRAVVRITDTPEPLLVVTPHTWFPAWEVTGENRLLQSVPVYLDLMGVRAPPGTTRIEMSFSRRRGTVALLWAFSMLTILSSLGWGLSRRGGAERGFA